MTAIFADTIKRDGYVPLFTFKRLQEMLTIRQQDAGHE
jgi:hypothetical protein